jgi:ElaB/YqjD/DUF883 family membrane-anchored ribosome-binding protein
MQATGKQAKKAQKDLYHHVLKIKDALSDTAEGVKGRAGSLVSDLLQDLHDKESKIEGVVEDYVKEKPLHSLGFAVLAGIIIAKIVF